MRITLLPILRSPLTGAVLQIQSALEWYSEGDLKTGILESANGELFPVLTGIPILNLDDTANMTLKHIQAGSADAAAYDLLNGQPLYWVENPEHTFRQLLYQFVGRWSADYFYYRRSDPTFLAGISLLRVACGQIGWAFDLGCGCGHNSEALIHILPGQQIVGVDSVFKLLYLARHFIAPEAEFVCCDLEKGLPFASYQAGVVLCSDTFSFLSNKWGSAREMMRLLHDDGRLLVTRLLLNPPAHWNSSRFRLLSMEQYLPVFEPFNIQIFNDKDLRKSYLDADSIAPVGILPEHEQSCSFVVMKGREMPEKACSTFLDPYRTDRIYLNPLYIQDQAKCWRLSWPSPSYAQDYEANSFYLPTVLEQFEVQLNSFGGEGLLEGWLRQRILLCLPDRYGESRSPLLGLEWKV